MCILHIAVVICTHTSERKRQRKRERVSEIEGGERDGDRVAVASWHFAFLAGK